MSAPTSSTPASAPASTGAGGGAGGAPAADPLAPYLVPAQVSVAALDAAEAFEHLSEKEREYALNISDACWSGAKICLFQTSRESPGLFIVFQRLFHSSSIDELKSASLASGVTEDEFSAFIAYAATFYANLGNYKSFGDTKFVPSLPKDKFVAILKASPGYSAVSTLLGSTLDVLIDDTYNLEPRFRQLGLGAEGISTYYSSNISPADVEAVQRFMDAQKISPYNTRLFKTGEKEFQLRRAAALSTDADGLTGTFSHEGLTIHVVRGDHSSFLQDTCTSLDAASTSAANDTQKAMLAKYSESFREGSVDAHIDGSRHWIMDKGPVVESYIGFIESYQDPAGARGEWEGFVAVVNKATSAKFGTLVDAAPEMLGLLPWGAGYEKDKFHRPDFTSLEVLTFASSGIPAGISIPNYANVRQEQGFKNVSLGNVLRARDFKERVTFLCDADQDDFRGLIGPAFEVQVGLHELLGHGSGKEFMEADDGTLNFDKTAVKNPDTGEPVTSWYKPGQTYDSMFGSYGSSMEECRAECVGIFLCVQARALEIFGHTGEQATRVKYINWLNMARAGLLALQFYTPEARKWGQAHMQARYAILQVLLEAGEGLVEIVGTDGLTMDNAASYEEGESGIHVKLDVSKIESVGVPAIGRFLNRLQFCKSTASVDAGKALFDKYTAVPPPMEALRAVVVAKRKERPLFVQPVMKRNDAGSVELTSFPSTPEGVIDSFVARFPAQDDGLVSAFQAEWAFHPYDEKF